jgi:lipopolysaccharide/colanic/teichoic acid biosynthesis glycosyltransferase
MSPILSKIISFVKLRFSDIMLFIIVILLIMLAFAAGYIAAKYQAKSPILIQQKQ